MKSLVAVFLLSVAQGISYNVNAIWPDTPCHCTDALAQRRRIMQLEDIIAALQAQGCGHSYRERQSP
jgi:hypothetical protein